MISRYHIRLFFVVLCLVSLNSLWGQGGIPMATQQEGARTEPDSVVILPFSATGLTEAFSSANTLISESLSRQYSEKDIELHREEVDTLFSVINGFLGDSVIVKMEGVSIREMNQISQRADHYSNELLRLQDYYIDEARVFEEQIAILDRNAQRWQLTLTQEGNEDLIASRAERIERILHRLDSVTGLLNEDMKVILLLQDRFAGKRGELGVVTKQVKSAKEAMSEILFSREMPGFFKDLVSLGDSSLLPGHLKAFKNTVESDWAMLKKDYLAALIVTSLFFVVFLVFAIWFRTNYQRIISTDRFHIADMHRTIINSPVATAVFTVALLVRFILYDLPNTFFMVNVFILLFPLSVLVIRLFGSKLKKWMIVLLFVYALISFYELAYVPDIYLRVLLMIISFTGLWLFSWLLFKKPFEGALRSVFLSVIFRALILGFLVLNFIAVIANLMGAFQLTEFFALLPIQITILAIGVLVTIRVLDVLFYLLLVSRYLQKLNVVKEEFEVIYQKTVRFLDFFLWLFFFSSALRYIRQRDAFVEWGTELLSRGRTIGSVEFNFINILILIFVIWLSVMITRIVSHILEKDVFTRVKMAKGVPSTIILMLRVVLITGGFLLAMAAAGMKLTNLSIVLGAFSVGIGFGLQNIFNNMVSGLILAFERPIKVGDVVQVGELIGEVRAIGLRSSTVKSFDGAEVIVPNGNLISNEMINWTKSDSNRRMDIRIGVAYGTDPKSVKDILLDIASKQEKVSKTPSPAVYFDDFGDSSLNFRLLAWVHIDYKLKTESDIRFELDSYLKEASIEIPFPQTDVHVRSNDTQGPVVRKTTVAKITAVSKKAEKGIPAEKPRKGKGPVPE